MYEIVYASPRLPPKISLKHDWMKELGSEVARQPEGEVARQAKGSQPTQPNPNPNHDRTEKPVVCSQSVVHPQRSTRWTSLQNIWTATFKQADNYRVRELVKKIENHPRRQSLQ